MIENHRLFRVLLFLISVQEITSVLVDSLEKVVFLNHGVTHAEDNVVFSNIDILDGSGGILMEPENITTFNKWNEGVGTPIPYRFLEKQVAPCRPGAEVPKMDMPGGDLMEFVPSPGVSQTCQTACCNDAQCVAYVFVTAPANIGACIQGQPCCFLKSKLSPLVPSSYPDLVSAKVTPAQVGAAAPPSGIRSAVPLGGITTGAVELRGDGTLHEWTITNQNPGGAAKIQEYPQAYFAVRQNNVSRALQTASKVNVPNVAALEYSGTYPVSRIQVQDNALDDVALYAFSTYKVGDQAASSRPAIAFVATAPEPVAKGEDVSFMFQLPLNVETDQIRVGTPIPGQAPAIGKDGSLIASFVDCLHACQANPACLSWNFNGTCSLQSDAPLNFYSRGTNSGLKFSWTVDAENNCLSLNRPEAVGPAAGAVTLCAASDDVVAFAAGTSDDETELFTRFDATGSVQGGAADTLTGAFGAVSVSYVANSSISQDRTADKDHLKNTTIHTGLGITMGWYFPNKDHYSQVVGNQYRNYYKSAQDAAWGTTPVATRGGSLEAVLIDLLALHEPFLGPSSSLPAWLGDQLVNSLSHIRTAMWFAECAHCHVSADPRINGTGFWRQWESYGCNDLDSIHNDGERHIPYIMFFPDSTRNKLAAWAGNQFPNGMLAEQIHNANPDQGEGRVMSDSSSMFVLYVLELLNWDNDLATVQLYWPVIQKIVQWMISTTTQIGVPYKLETTYDILQFDVKYDASAYATLFHLAGMRACVELATAMKDQEYMDLCSLSLDNVTAAFNRMQWAGDHYAAGSSGCVRDTGCSEQIGVFSDTLYAQVLGYTLGLGSLVDAKNLQAHLGVVEDRNCAYPDGSGGLINGTCPNGLITLTDRPRPSGIRTDRQIWQMMNHDHATVGLHLGNDVDKSLIFSERSAKAWSEVQNDQWGTAAVSDATGLPTVINHYGYHMTSWHIPLALSGQDAHLYPAASSSLTFSPKLDADQTVWSFPVLLPGRLGTIALTANATYSLSLQFGSLDVATLSVNGCAAASPVSLQPGQTVSWNVCQ